MANILFLVEGADTEIQCYKVLKRVLKSEVNDSIKFYSYKTNIYNLYNDLKQDNSLDVMALLRERAKKANDNEKLDMLTNLKFGEIYLIFDLDPQDSKFDTKKVNEMLKIFDNETENGKLYINYPMVESFKHFKSIPDNEYINYEVTLDECVNYKDNIDKISCITDWRKIRYNKYAIITRQNIEKMSYLILDNNKCTYFEYQKKINQKNLFAKQKENIRNNSKIYVVNTFCLWPVDYFDEKFFYRIMNI